MSNIKNHTIFTGDNLHISTSWNAKETVRKNLPNQHPPKATNTPSARRRTPRPILHTRTQPTRTPPPNQPNNLINHIEHVSSDSATTETTSSSTQENQPEPTPHPHTP